MAVSLNATVTHTVPDPEMGHFVINLFTVLDTSNQSS